MPTESAEGLKRLVAHLRSLDLHPTIQLGVTSLT
jgi:hypothetical protein